MSRHYVKRDAYYWRDGISIVASRRETKKKQKALRSTRALKQLVDKSANAERWEEQEKIIINYNTEESTGTCVHSKICKHFSKGE